jgi:hypothetical protein
LCKFPKPLYIQKFNFYSKRNFLRISAHLAQPRPRASPLRPAGHRRPARPSRPKPRWRIFRKAYSLRHCALRQRRLLSLTSPPCGARLSASSPSTRWMTIATSSRRLRPPCAARPPTSGCQARSSLHALIPLLISPLNPSSSRPTISGVKAITAGRFPPPAPACPSPTTIKGRGAPPGHHHTHPALICSLSSLQRSPHRAPPPPIVPHHRLAVSDPSPTPLAVGEAHRCPLPLFLNRSEVPRTGAPFRPFSGEPPPRRCPWSTVDRRRPWSTGFPLGKQFLEIPISGILHLGPSISSKSTRSP